MWRFYWVLVCGIPEALWNAFDLTISASAVVIFLLTLLNRRLGERLVMSWHAISPWWSLVPVAMIFIYGLMRSNYEHYCHLQSGFNRSTTELREENSALKAEVSDLRNPKVSAEEERKRKLVAEKLEPFSQKSKQAVRYIWDCGIVYSMGLYAEFGAAEINETLRRGKLSGLLIFNGDMIEINPELRAAIDLVLKSEGF